MPDRTLFDYLRDLQRFRAGDEHALDSWKPKAPAKPEGDWHKLSPRQGGMDLGDDE